MLYEGGTGFNGKYIFQSFQLVKQAMLPRVHGLALKTTVAAVSILLIQNFISLFYLFTLFGWR